MVEVNARLKRMSDAGLLDWLLVEDPEAADGYADPVIEQGLRDRIEALSAAFAAGMTVAQGTKNAGGAAAWHTQDDYNAGQCLAEQTGAGAVLTFTFASPVNLVLIEAVGSGSQVARVDPFGGTPTANLGIRADDAVPTYLPVTTSSVKVFAPASMVVSVAGFRRQ